jgi:cysteine-rich repeat protein
MRSTLASWIGALAGLALVLSSVTAPRESLAGAFIYAGDVEGFDIITHPPGYSSTHSGPLQVEVCVDPSSANASDMLIALENAAIRYTDLGVTTGNLSSGLSNNIPSAHVDFESVLLHEVGHCLGLAHPNLASESGLTGADRNYTMSTRGPDGSHDLARGADSIRGSGDDLRDDDVNLHWFPIADNNPFVIGPTVDSSTYSRSLVDLPGGDLYAANGDRAVAYSLGFGSTEAVMQQGTFNDEAQRTLAADDVATLRLAMAGIDEVVGGGDDYTLQIVSQGTSANCDIIVDFDDTETDFAQCNVQGSYIAPGHIVITTPRIYFNSDYNWYFNTVPAVGCGSGALDAGEACDDGNLDDGDGCDSSCQLEPGWSCAGEPSLCDGVCGDSAVVGSEECDDGNLLPADGCSDSCTEEPGFDCGGEPSTCQEICGDGQLVGDEQCDDGNTLDGDCCSMVCAFEQAGSACADDANECTDEACDGAGTCQHTPNAVPCEDGDACSAGDVCAAGVCMAGGPLDCDDGLYCNGLETCVSLTGCAPGSLDVDDGVACTVDGCDEATDTISHAPDDPSCDDGLYCSGNEYCDLTLGCQSAGLDLDDGILCTLDGCDEVGVVITHFADDSSCDDGDSCTADSCDELTGCAFVPVPGCGALVPGVGAWGRLLVSMMLLTAGLLSVSFSRQRD